MTRLVVLGAVRQFQPVHGYFLRRELMTWHVDEWANIQAGSVYNALRTLQNDGYVYESGTESDGKRPPRTTYSLTDAGDVEFLRLLRDALWHVEPFDTKPSMAIASFMWVLSREEVTTALAHRQTEIEATLTANEYHMKDTAESESTPDYVREIFELSSARLRGEADWVRQLRNRIDRGEYRFDGEAG